VEYSSVLGDSSYLVTVLEDYEMEKKQDWLDILGFPNLVWAREGSNYLVTVLVLDFPS